MRNVVNTMQLAEMKAEDAAALPVDQLQMLQAEIDCLKANAKMLDDKLNTALLTKYGEEATNRRKADGKDTGRVSIEDGEFTARADLPKKVEWDQKRLQEIAKTIFEDWSENPTDYMDVKFSVAESKWNAWTPRLKKLFEAARTVSVGKASVTLEKKASKNGN